jgi:choline dehydrogenase
VSGFDIVVVGGGAAGCVVASRVAAATSASVLLLEAGPDIRADTPEVIRDGWGMTRDLFDWGYRSEPGWFGDSRKIRRVRALGGTSSITRFAMRGSPADFEEWAALGNPGWGWDDVLPYFRRLETDLQFGDRPWHGDSGPIPITRYPDVDDTPVHAAMIEALEAGGFTRVDDHNRPGAVGAGRMPNHSRDGIRATTSSAYLPLGGTPSNLTIRPDSQVDRVVLDGSSARGVRLVDGTTIEARTVVLSGGTYGSPLILLRSGIGPAAQLREVGVDVRLDLAGVGENLSDHPTTSIDGGYRGTFRTSPLVHTAATFHSSSASSDAPPDLMFWVQDPDDEASAPQWVVEVVLLKPECRGRVRLRSANPADPPRIELPDPTPAVDHRRLQEGVRRAAEVLADERVRALCPDPVPSIATPRELDALIAENYYSIPHVVGTCAMGPSPDDGAVVDASGCVHGLESLYVVDASIVPTEPSGFTLLPTIMLAEKLAEVIAAAG